MPLLLLCVVCCLCECVFFSPLFCCLMKHFKHIKFLLYAYICVCQGVIVSPSVCVCVCVCTCVLPLVRLVVCRHVAVCVGLFWSATASCDLFVSPTHTHTHTHAHTSSHTLCFMWVLALWRGITCNMSIPCRTTHNARECDLRAQKP